MLIMLVNQCQSVHFWPVYSLIKTSIKHAMENPIWGVHKLGLQDEVGRWSKKSTFCQHTKFQHRGVGGQKKLKS